MRETALCILVLGLIPAGAQEAARVRGVVLDARGGEPLARVVVRLTGTPRETLTDEAGRFEIRDLGPGEYNLQASTVGYRLLRKGFALASGETKEFEVILSPETFRHTESIEVSAGPFEPLRQDSPSELTLQGAEVKNLASVLADDPLRAVQSLPGVSSNDDFNSRFSLRGAGYERLGLYLDGVLLHAPFHMVAGEPASGSLTAFNGDMLDTVALYSGAWPARYAGRTGGILDIHTRDGSRLRPAARVTASASNAGIVAEGPLGSGRRGSWLAGARKSYLQYIIRRTSGDPTLAFGFLDSQMRLAYDASPRHNLTLSLIDGLSDLDRTSARSRLGINSIMTGDLHLTVANLGWRCTPVETLAVNTRAAFERERFVNRNRDELDLGGGHYGEWFLESSAQWIWSRMGGLDAGFSLRRLRDAGFSNRYQFNPFAVRRLEDYRGNGVHRGGFLVQSFSALEGRVHAAAGVRLERHSVSGVAVVLPHASLAVSPFGATRLQFGWGQYAQYPELMWLFSVAGNRSLLPERATHLIAAVEQRLGERTRLRAEFYQRVDRDLLARPFYEPRLVAGRVFNPQAFPPVENSVRGYARGFEVFLQSRTANRLTGWVSYSLGYTRMRDGTALVAYPADADQRHTANAYLSYRLRPTLNLSVKWIYGSGFPIPGYLRESGGRYYLAEARNALRLDSYQRADARINKDYAFRRTKLTLYGEVINLLNRRNYRFDTFNGYNAKTGQAYFTTDKMFPIIPSLGVVLEM